MSFVDLRPGAMLGPYELVRWIGGGGQGQVWEADAGQGHVALKVMTPGGDQRARERFAKELLAARAIDSTYVAQPVDWDAAGGWIAYERVVGSPLSEVLARASVQLPLQRALDVLADIAAGVVAIHEQGLTHCDLKPSNVLVTPRDRAKVLDLGAVSTGTRSELSVAYGVATPGWAAPEQGFGPAGVGPVTSAADVHALGLLIVKTVTGHSAYSDRYQPGSPDLRGMPVSLASVAQACLLVKPSARPPAPWVFAQLRRLRDDLRAESDGTVGRAGSSGAVRWPVLTRIADATFRTDGSDGSLVADAALEPTPCAGEVVTDVVLTGQRWHRTRAADDSFDDWWADTTVARGAWAQLRPRFGLTAGACQQLEAEPATRMEEGSYVTSVLEPPAHCPSCGTNFGQDPRLAEVPGDPRLVERLRALERDQGGLMRHCRALQTCPAQTSFALELFVNRLVRAKDRLTGMEGPVGRGEVPTLHRLLVTGADNVADQDVRARLNRARQVASRCPVPLLLQALRAPAWLLREPGLSRELTLEPLLADPPVVPLEPDAPEQTRRAARRLAWWAGKPESRALLAAAHALRQQAADD